MRFSATATHFHPFGPSNSPQNAIITLDQARVDWRRRMAERAGEHLHPAALAAAEEEDYETFVTSERPPVGHTIDRSRVVSNCLVSKGEEDYEAFVASEHPPVSRAGITVLLKRLVSSLVVHGPGRL